MTPTIGQVALAVAALATLALVVRPRLAPRALPAVVAGALAAATSALLWALVTNDYTVAYVADSARRSSSPAFRAAGLWGGMAGSLLLWTTLLAGGGWHLSRRLGDADIAELAPPARRVLAASQAVFLLPLLTVTRPFERVASPPIDGRGLHPLLEHPAMLYHPPLLYLGLTLLFPAAAVAVTAMWRGAGPAADAVLWRIGGAAVVVGGLGLLAGAHWAYAELGWGGFWAWDPIENGALVPWLVAVAALHVRRSPLARPLMAAAALLAAGGAFVARSGATVSPHAFAEARDVGWILLAGITVATAGLVLLLVRRREVAGSPLPRRPVLAVALLSGSAGVIAIGTFAPALLVMAGASARTIDVAFYGTFAGPLLAVGVGLAGREALRRGASVAARVAHVGVVALAVGVVGSTTGWDATVPLRQGLTTEVRGRSVTLVAVTERDVRGRHELVAEVLVDGARFRPALRADGGGGVTAETSIRSGMTGDLLVSARRMTLDRSAVLDLRLRPLVSWVWSGAALAIGGLALSLTRRRKVGDPRPALPPLPFGASAPTGVAALATTGPMAAAPASVSARGSAPEDGASRGQATPEGGAEAPAAPPSEPARAAGSTA